MHFGVGLVKISTSCCLLWTYSGTSLRKELLSELTIGGFPLSSLASQDLLEVAHSLLGFHNKCQGCQGEKVHTFSKRGRGGESFQIGIFLIESKFITKRKKTQKAEVETHYSV